MTNPTRKIWVKFQKEGIHCWPEAKNMPHIATGDKYDTSFLSYPHRHMFHFRVSIDVQHQDREIEFIQVKRWLENMYGEGTLELNHRSCEMIAEELYAQIHARYPGRAVEITVSEDDENGATLSWC
jgi:hypothetical protein